MTFALLAVIGNLVNLLSLLTVRAVIGFKGVKSPALLPIAKGSTYTLYIGVWISFQSTISGITRASDVIERLNNDIGTISPIQTIFSIISLVTTFLLTPIQLAQIVQSYGILYKGLLPIVSKNQMGSHLNAAVQQSMTLSSLALFGFTMMSSEKANILDEPTVFSTLYTSVYGISMVGMLIAIAFGRITTIATQIETAAEKVEGDKETLTMSLDLDLSKDQEVLLRGYSGKKDSWNGTTVIILQKLEKEEKLKVKVTKTEVKSLEDDEMTIGYAQVESCLSKSELEAQVTKVDLEKKLLDYNIIQQRENLVKMETLYLITCQLTDAIMVVEIVVSFIFADVSGLAMFNDMRVQADDERYRAINDPESCLAKSCITVQKMACSYWRDCGGVFDIDTGEAYPNCGAYCRISPEVRS